MKFTGIDLADVEKIEFAFSQTTKGTPLKVVEFPSEDVVAVDGNILGVIWTPEDTLLFDAGRAFYADTRITMKDTTYQPKTPILKLQMQPTLFEGAVS